MLKVQTGQIIEFYSNSCCVASAGKEFKCTIQGRINLVVGDLVELKIVSNNDSLQGIVTKRLERVTTLYKSKEKVKKPIAANVSHIGILVTKSPKTNLEFIDKWIAISKNASIEPFVIFNKIDLLQDDAFDEIQKVYKGIGIKTFQISAKLSTNIDELKKYLSERTTIFVGNSGSGKSTLINNTLYELAAQTLNGAQTDIAPFKKVKGMELFDKVVHINQSPIGRTPRSNPAIYKGVST